MSNKNEKKKPKEELKDPGEEKIKIPGKLPVLALRDVVIFPYMIVPLYVGRNKSKNAVDFSLNANRMILLVTQKEPKVEDPLAEDMYTVGTVALVVRMLKLPDGRMRILVQGISRARIMEMEDDGKIINATIGVIKDKEPKRLTMRNQALIKSVKDIFSQIGKMERQIPDEIFVITENIEEPGKLSDIVVSNLDLKIEESQKILEEENPAKRLQKVHDVLKYQLEILNLQNQINIKAQGEMDKNQREYFLRQQLKAIKKELDEDGESSEEIKIYLKRFKDLKAPKDAKFEIEKNIERLKKMHPESAESTVVRNYLDWMLDVPWETSSKDNEDLRRAEKVLNADHFGLEKVKERILEYLSVRKLTKTATGPILCFVGPPGVGKTSLGKSIANALNKKFVRISLGGVRDEAEIRGHRRTYVGALPGKIIQELKKVKTNNPVFMMDEVDKIGADFRGDPSSALLEVLDPEQNDSFTDHYLGVSFDLSKVLFITTANLLDPIQPAFKDRMEVIQIHGYMEEEKIEIARRHLIPRQVEKNGLNNELITFTRGAIQGIIARYTREAGVRNLEREIGSICRKIAKKVADGKRKAYKITLGYLEKYLGPPKLFNDQLLKRDNIGVATGMAWTPYGGDILFIEAKLFPGKGNLILTGSLGEVMKESATAALSFIKSESKKLGLEPEVFEKNDIHIHVPEGGTPKDGPSAGLTITTALCSAFTKVPTNRKVAMTGEITLRGSLLPVGGVKEKVLAAKRAGLKKIIIPELNRKDLLNLKEKYLDGIEFVYAKNIKNSVNEALLKAIF